jgi:hypothetical protein
MWFSCAMPSLASLPLRLALAAGALIVLATAGATSGAALTACAPSDLTASMTVINGSPGAGSISYNVRLKNRSGGSCSVSGRPGLTLLGRHGHALPTHVVADRPGTGTAALITLAHGATAVAQARFSPDIPGSGEPAKGRCERPAYGVRVALASPGQGSLTGKVTPPTPVCEHGRIVLGLLHAAG